MQVLLRRNNSYLRCQKLFTASWKQHFSTTVAHHNHHHHKKQQNKLSYHVIGDPAKATETPIVVMHGLFGHKSLWRSIFQLDEARDNILMNGNRCAYFLDARNHGESFHDPLMSYEALAHDLNSFILDQKWKNVILVGHSMGGKQVMQLCLSRANPSLVSQYAPMSDDDLSSVDHYNIEKSIILDIAPASYVNNERWTIPNLIRAMNDLPMEFSEQYRTRHHVDDHLAKYIPDKRVRLFLATNLMRRSDKKGWQWIHNHGVLSESVVQMGGFPEYYHNRQSEVNKYDGDVLFIRGGNSFYCFEPYESEIDRLFSNYQIETIPDAGHWVHSDNPQMFVHLLAKYINNELN